MPKINVKPPTAILAIDPATKCGFAHSAGAFGTWDLAIKTDESGGMRLLRLIGKLEEIRRGPGIDLIAFEAVRHAAGSRHNPRTLAAELQGILKLFCEQNEINYRGFSPSEIKRHATGRGNADKNAIIDAAGARFPDFQPGRHDDNAADALWILDLAQTTLGNQ